MPASKTKPRRAIGIARQSHGDGESVAQQTARIREACDRDGLRLLDVHPEQDVSGGTPLARREGLRRAVELVEAGKADVIIGAYFDRLVRSLKVQAELVERVEAAGGKVLALDTGELTNGSAGQWLSGTMLGAVSEYHRRTSAERAGEAQARAVARGVWMSPYTPAGYDRGGDGRLVPNADAGMVLEAFELRAAGVSVASVFERVRGLGLTYASVGRMLKSRAYLGEVHFGRLVNRAAHPAIPGLDEATWKRAQRAKATPGRKGKSDRLLARLGVLLCASCNGRMSANTGKSSNQAIYRCGGHVGDRCPQRVTIGAEVAEAEVVAATKRALADVEGRASAETNAVAARAEADRLQDELDALVGALRASGLLGEPSAVEQLTAARVARDEALERSERLAGASSARVVSVADWDRLTVAEQRALIRSTVRATVAPAAPGLRGAARIAVEVLGH
jgi:site-specific DNA recombinase